MILKSEVLYNHLRLCITTTVIITYNLATVIIGVVSVTNVQSIENSTQCHYPNHYNSYYITIILTIYHLWIITYPLSLSSGIIKSNTQLSTTAIQRAVRMPCLLRLLKKKPRPQSHSSRSLHR